MLPQRIETPRLLLRSVREGDGAMTNAAIAETFEQLHEWMPWAQVLPTPEESEANAREAEAKFAVGTQFDFSILLRGSEGFVGRIGIWPIPEGDFEIGYWCRTSAQRRSYLSEAVLAPCEAVSKYLGAARIIIRCDSRNLASQNVALRCGFLLRKTRRGDATANDGSVRDTLIFALNVNAA